MSAEHSDPTSYNALHMHGHNHWSAVYCVEAGAPDRVKSGVLEFQDPRPAAAVMPIEGYRFGNTYSVVPVSGMLVLFPSWLDHWVHPYVGEGEHISIAFNLVFVQ